MRRRQLLRIPAQKKNFVRKEMPQGPSQKLGKQDGGEQHQVKSRSPVLIALLEKPVNTQVEEVRKPPDVLRVRRAIAQEPAENADSRQQGHGQPFVMEHRRKGNDDSGGYPRHIAAQQPGEQAALQAEVRP